MADTHAANLVRRAACVGAILLGLFVMHGLSSAVPGCLGTAPMAPHGAAPGAAMATDASTVASRDVTMAESVYARASGGPVVLHEGWCVSNPPRDRLAGFLLLALGVTLLGVPGPIPLLRARRMGQSRAPPRDGAALLSLLCILRI